MRFLHVRLDAPQAQVAELERFYDALGVDELEWRGSDAAPFYHFALLVPGDRFDAAHAWAKRELDVVGDVFDFDAWDARACYFHDPAGNIGELIAHRGLEEHGGTGAFEPSELRGLSEVGLVGDVARLVGELEALGLQQWDGDELAFVGERARTFICAATGRGWLPTGRPAEPHPVEAVVESATGIHTVRCGTT